MKSQMFFWLREAVMKISIVSYPNKLEELTHEGIVRIIRKIYSKK